MAGIYSLLRASFKSTKVKNWWNGLGKVISCLVQTSFKTSSPECSCVVTARDSVASVLVSTGNDIKAPRSKLARGSFLCSDLSHVKSVYAGPACISQTCQNNIGNVVDCFKMPHF